MTEPLPEGWEVLEGCGSAADAPEVRPDLTLHEGATVRRYNPETKRFSTKRTARRVLTRPQPEEEPTFEQQVLERLDQIVDVLNDHADHVEDLRSRVATIEGPAGDAAGED